MKIFEVFEVNSKPIRDGYHYSEYRVYDDALYIEAECNADCFYGDEAVTDEEYNRRVELELKSVLETLEVHGRYPINGIPKFVAY